MKSLTTAISECGKDNDDVDETLRDDDEDSVGVIEASTSSFAKFDDDEAWLPRRW